MEVFAGKGKGERERTLYLVEGNGEERDLEWNSSTWVLSEKGIRIFRKRASIIIPKGGANR
jgi:hypothetical protein